MKVKRSCTRPQQVDAQAVATATQYAASKTVGASANKMNEKVQNYDMPSTSKGSACFYFDDAEKEVPLEEKPSARQRGRTVSEGRLKSENVDEASEDVRKRTNSRRAQSRARSLLTHRFNPRNAIKPTDATTTAPQQGSSRNNLTETTNNGDDNNAAPTFGEQVPNPNLQGSSQQQQSRRRVRVRARARAPRRTMHNINTESFTLLYGCIGLCILFLGSLFVCIFVFFEEVLIYLGLRKKTPRNRFLPNSW